MTSRPQLSGKPESRKSRHAKAPTDSRRIKLRINLRDRNNRSKPSIFLSLVGLFLGVLAVYLAWQIHGKYTFSLQSPLDIRVRWPIVVAQRVRSSDAAGAQVDQFGRSLTPYQQYACEKFGPACRVALAIQRAENPAGKCEIYHYNSDGTLDWGYFQINTVHLEERGLVLRDLLDCKANIDFAYALYLKSHGFSPWKTYKDGTYLRYFRSPTGSGLR